MKEVHYLDIELMEKMCHRLAVTIFNTKNDPISPFRKHTKELLDSALTLPKQSFSGKELYPTLIDKAAVLYYTLNKNHPFENGNKRIATTSLLVFLHINDAWLDAGKRELLKKTLWVANSAASEREKVLSELKNWIGEHVVTDSPDK